MDTNHNNSWIKPREFTTEWAGRTLKISTGLVAQQASGSVVVQYGETVVLVTTTMATEMRGELDYFPLMVDYEERLYAAGIIKGSRFIKRETRPTTEAVLTARLIDRCIRPLFDDSVRLDVQVVSTVLSVDGENDADIPSLIGAVAALITSDIPWAGPIAGSKVGLVDGEFILNPTYAQLEESDLDLFVAGDGETTIMLEAGAKEIPEAKAYEAIQFGLEGMKPVIELLKKVEAELGVEKRTLKTELTAEELEANKEIEELKVFLSDLVKADIEAYFAAGKDSSKQMRKASLKEMKKKYDAALKEKQVGKDKRKTVLKSFKEMAEQHIGDMILKTQKRVDGRAVTEVRPLDVMVGLLPRTHGSGLFTRGETQVMTVATVAGPGAAQTLEGIDEHGEKSYIHHYNFPGFSVGEVKPLRGPSRRDWGHGALAEKALVPMIPSKEEFPYTIRLVSEVLGSNGSSSMASACGSTLALMDAGVPIKSPVAGVAMGLISNEKGEWVVLTDLQDLEDAKGGMDFKVTGTENGITAIQLDTKTHGLANEIIKQTLTQSQDGIADILKAMLAVLPAPREEMSKHAPRVEGMQINPDKIRDVIGPGGKVINKIIEETGAEIDIEQDGSVFISTSDAEGMAKAKQWITDLTKEVEAGEIYEGTVVRLMDFGAFVELLPGKDGLVHISEMAHHRVEKVTDVVKLGDKVRVKVKEIDDKGRVNLSMKALLEAPAGGAPRAPKPSTPRRDQKPSGTGSTGSDPKPAAPKKPGFFNRKK
jgi:polyribonucleotide nucleotidyltransferase